MPHPATGSNSSQNRQGQLTLGIKRPARPYRGKQKRVHPAPDAAMLERAAKVAAYGENPYHCSRPGGQAPIIRAKPASHCPRWWSDAEATKTLREAIAEGRVSETWEEGFPRHVWHRDGDVLYEARHTRGPVGSFHAYPIENSQAPHGLDL